MEIVQNNFPEEVNLLEDERMAGYLDLAACGSLIVGLSMIVESIDASNPSDSLGFTLGCVFTAVSGALWVVRDKYFGDKPTEDLG